MDIFSQLAYALVRMIDAIAPGLLGFFPHCCVFLAIPLILCMISDRFFGHHQFLVLVCLTGGLFVAGTLPVPDISAMSPTAKAWTVALCVLLSFFLPVALARCISSNRDRQSSIIVLLYLAVGILYVLNFGSPSGVPMVGLRYP